MASVLTNDTFWGTNPRVLLDSPFDVIPWDGTLTARMNNLSRVVLYGAIIGAMAQRSTRPLIIGAAILIAIATIGRRNIEAQNHKPQVSADAMAAIYQLPPPNALPPQPMMQPITPPPPIAPVFDGAPPQGPMGYQDFGTGPNNNPVMGQHRQQMMYAGGVDTSMRPEDGFAPMYAPAGQSGIQEWNTFPIADKTGMGYGANNDVASQNYESYQSQMDPLSRLP